MTCTYEYTVAIITAFGVVVSVVTFKPNVSTLAEVVLVTQSESQRIATIFVVRVCYTTTEGVRTEDTNSTFILRLHAYFGL